MGRLAERLVAGHRREQRRVRAQFLSEFLDTWELLRWDAIDDTFAGWTRAVMRSLRTHRQESADLAATYHQRLRLAQAPQLIIPPPEPVFIEPVTKQELVREPDEGLNRAERERLTVQRAKAHAQRAVEVAGAGPRDPAPTRHRRPATRADQVRPTIDWSTPTKPVIDWGKDDKVAQHSLLVTGPGELKRRAALRQDERTARAAALELSASEAARHVLNGGRRTSVELATADPATRGWVRVTGADPCSFCVMLASRGVDYRPYRTEAGASFEAHPHCQCTAEAVFVGADPTNRAQQREWKALWDEVTAGHSGRDARNAFRRHWEGLQREQRRAEGQRDDPAA